MSELKAVEVARVEPEVPEPEGYIALWRKADMGFWLADINSPHATIKDAEIAAKEGLGAGGSIRIYRLTAAPKQEPEAKGQRIISDDYGNDWSKCDREDCSLQIVRPGKVQCNGECEQEPAPSPALDEQQRRDLDYVLDWAESEADRENTVKAAHIRLLVPRLRPLVVKP